MTDEEFEDTDSLPTEDALDQILQVVEQSKPPASGAPSLNNGPRGAVTAALEPTQTESLSAELLGPVLLSIEPSQRPEPMPVCGPCPKSMWHLSTEGLRCFCQAMHAITWDQQKPVTMQACDGLVDEEQ